MLRIIVVSHGTLAKSLIEVSFEIYGKQKDVIAVSYPEDETKKDFKSRLASHVRNEEEILFLADLYEGTPFKIASQFVLENPKKRGLLAGINLAILIEAYTLRSGKKRLAEVLDYLKEIGREGVETFKKEGGGS